MHADPYGDPRLAVVVAGRRQQVAYGRDRPGGVVFAREAGDEERDRLVADELVHDPVPPVDDALHHLQAPYLAVEDLRPQLLLRLLVRIVGEHTPALALPRGVHAGAKRIPSSRDEQFPRLSDRRPAPYADAHRVI